MSYYLTMEIRQVAISYIKTLSNSEKEKLKTMLAHDVSCGKDFAIQNGIEPAIFNKELKNILEVR